MNKTLEELQSLAVGTLQEWFRGYSNSSGKVVLHTFAKDGLVFELREGPEYAPNPVRYKISVEVLQL